MTPLMRQYHALKEQYQDGIMLFQIGDFYEIFYDDAVQAAPVLGIVLTRRGSAGQEIPLCGFPRHVVDTYKAKLIAHGFRVVLCDQLPATAAGFIERVVTQVLTPGTLSDEQLLDAKSPLYIAFVTGGKEGYAFISAELLTGHLYFTHLSGDTQALESACARFCPQEIVAPAPISKMLRSLGYTVTEMAQPALGASCDAWLAQRSLGQMQPLMRQAYELLYAYLDKYHKAALTTLQECHPFTIDDALRLDAVTRRHLELVENTYDGTTQGTLFSVIDRAITAMGSRQIKKWILGPLIDASAIKSRLSLVKRLIEDPRMREQFEEALKTMGDLERVVGRIALSRATFHDYLHLLRALKTLRITYIPSLVGFGRVYEELDGALSCALYTDTVEQWRIAPGYHAELDRLRHLIATGNQTILELEQREQQATGIPSLKIRFNNTYGYGIEVTKPHLALVPDHYRRLQTLTNRERFTTQELKDLEYDMRRAKQDSELLESELYGAVCAAVAKHTLTLKKTAQQLAILDGVVGFARAALEHQWTEPELGQTRDCASRDCLITQGRHPVVECMLKKQAQEQFIANDLMLTDDQRLWIITGPNMGGKSTFLRQAALIAIMAQAGSFVPARRAVMPIFDRIFTRIGAADHLAQGKSTFFVEMEETALICHEATERSLVILDEIGRGTSTYDGLAIAQAVLEYIYKEVKARCLFATHYHELTALIEDHRGIVAYHAATAESADGLVLLHEIRPGCAQGSFGLEVARRAKLPDSVLVRAQTILQELNQ